MPLGGRAAPTASWSNQPMPSPPNRPSAPSEAPYLTSILHCGGDCHRGPCSNLKAPPVQLWIWRWLSCSPFTCRWPVSSHTSIDPQFSLGVEFRRSGMDVVLRGDVGGCEMRFWLIYIYLERGRTYWFSALTFALGSLRFQHHTFWTPAMPASTRSITFDSWLSPTRTTTGPWPHPSFLLNSHPVISCLFLILASRLFHPFYHHLHIAHINFCLRRLCSLYLVSHICDLFLLWRIFNLLSVLSTFPYGFSTRPFAWSFRRDLEVRHLC